MNERGNVMRGLGFGVCLLAAGLAGCTAARIDVPTALTANAQPIQLTGMGFGQRGSFQLGASSGTFVRHAMSAKDGPPFLSDDIKSYFGNGSFEVTGSDFDGRVTGDCRYLEAEADTGPATITTVPFRYSCHFSRNGRPLPGRLLLHAAPRAAGPLMAETRVGTFEVGGRTYGIAPIHNSPQLTIPTAEPLGYRFVADAGDVGAIDVNGERKTIYAPAQGPDREPVLIASLALSVLWRS
jgi:hypothetical protein